MTGEEIERILAQWRQRGIYAAVLEYVESEALKRAEACACDTCRERIEQLRRGNLWQPTRAQRKAQRSDDRSDPAPEPRDSAAQDV